LERRREERDKEIIRRDERELMGQEGKWLPPVQFDG
jgi:hypothetical protein